MLRVLVVGTRSIRVSAGAPEPLLVNGFLCAQGRCAMSQRGCPCWKSVARAALISAVIAGPAFAQSPIVIVSPSPFEFVDARAPYTVRWESPNIRRNAGFFVDYVHDSVRQAICAVAPSARECVWADPPSPADFGGTLVIEARAVNGSALAATESEPFTLHEGSCRTRGLAASTSATSAFPGVSKKHR